jgi:hypothetical protein
MERTSKKYEDMMPGMSQVVEAGDELVVRDREGQEFSITAKVDEKTLAFITAFDEWFIIRHEGVRGVVLDALWNTVERADLPLHVQEKLTSFRRQGLFLRGHNHA